MDTTRAVVAVEAVSTDGWDRVRAVRLAALEEAPDAFWATLEEERDRPPAHWRGWIDRERSRVLLATIRTSGGDRRDVGLAVVRPHHDDPQAAGLYAVWVAPEARGRGVGDALMLAATEQATALGYARLLLDVGDHNEPAIGLYERFGFEPTGRTTTAPPPRDHITEHERARELP